MFQALWRSGVAGVRSGAGTFRARSKERDAETDQSWTLSILTAIEAALIASETEQSGLTRRVDEVLARAAITMGNDSDEYLYRDERDTHHQDIFNLEISNGQRRIQQLSDNITHYRFLKTVMLSRFPDLRSDPKA